MQWLARICVQRPVFASVLMLIVIVLGVVGYGRLGVDQFPNIDLPFVIVTTRLDGASPEEVETDITDKIEGAVNTIDSIDELITDRKADPAICDALRERRLTVTLASGGAD